MKQQQVFLFLYSALVGVVCLLVQAGSLPTETLIAGTLAAACLLGIRLLLILGGRLPWLRALLLAAALVVALALGRGMYPFACVLLALFALQSAPGAGALPLMAAGALLLGLVLWPPFWAVASIPLCLAPLLFLHYAFARLALAHRALEERTEENERLRQRLDDTRKMAAAAERAARLAERNRLAVRLHDKVGHGISGSILLLEGAQLAMEKDPEKAEQAMEMATENLRATVDEIRTELRQERARPEEAGLAQLAAQLARFETQHPAVRTELVTQGELSEIPPQVWVCLQENLTETLTNLLKHSSANHFSASLAVQKKLVRAQFLDNGAAGSFTLGMGLSAMEERCALCHGSCFFTAGPRGFSTLMTFTHLGG